MRLRSAAIIIGFLSVPACHSIFGFDDVVVRDDPGAGGNSQGGEPSSGGGGSSAQTGGGGSGAGCVDADCSGNASDCRGPGCVAGECGFVDQPARTACDDGAANADICDGMGDCVECIDESDCNGIGCVGGTCEGCPSVERVGFCDATSELLCFYDANSTHCQCWESSWQCDTCPQMEPSSASACAPDNMRCFYGDTQCFCSVGNWVCGTCPISQPTGGCVLEGVQCGYGGVSCTCTGGTWAC